MSTRVPLVAERIMPFALAGLALAGLAFGAALVDAGYAPVDTFNGFLDLFVGSSFIGVGLFAWWRRPSNLIGPLMIATGFLWFVAVLGNSTNATVFAIAGVLHAFGHATLIHLLLAFPSGRL
jgi:hypothetical protein